MSSCTIYRTSHLSIHCIVLTPSQIASDFINAFEKLIKAYGQIGEALPRFDRLSQALKAQPEFQNVLAMVYCDIIQFHYRAYHVFNSPGEPCGQTSSLNSILTGQQAWKRFFDTSWKRFDIRFAAVLESLEKHTDLVDKEANAYGVESILKSVSLIEDARQKIYDEATARIEERRDREFEAVLAWLDVQCYPHEDGLARLKERSVKGTCDWLHKHRVVHRWITAAPGNSKDSRLWIHGKPGSGIPSSGCATSTSY